MSPWADGSFFLAVSAVGLSGAVPFAVLQSLEALRDFLAFKMLLRLTLVQDITNCAEKRESYGGTDFLADQALEAIARNQIDRHEKLRQLNTL